MRFEFKFWCLCSYEGLVLKFKLYEGKDSDRKEGLTVGENVVTSLANGFVPKASSGYIDHFFTSLPLLEKFRHMNVNLTGTMRKDRVRCIPLSNFKKAERGTAEIFEDQDKFLKIVQ